MLHSIKAKLILAIVVIAVIFGALIFFTSVQMKSIDSTLIDLQGLQDVKSHVLMPQKDMNQFIAAMDSTVLFLELGDKDSAQAAFEGSVDAEQDISGEFEYLEANAPEELTADMVQAHLTWETAMEFLKMRAEALASEKGIALVRPSTEPTKVVDAHTPEGIAVAQKQFAGASFADLTEAYGDDEVNPVEVSDVAIDGADEKTGEFLEAKRIAGDKAVGDSSNTVLFGSLGALLAIVLVGAVVTTSVSRPLSMLKTGAEKIADGDLDYEFKNVPNDEVGAVIKAVEKMEGGLKTRIRNLEEVAGIVMVTGEEIGEAAQDAKGKGADVDVIIAKADQLKGLVGQMLDDTHK